MTAPWQITAISMQDENGDYATTVSAAQAVEIVFDAEEAYTTATAQVFRIKQDNERSGAGSPWEALPAEAYAVDDDSGTMVAVQLLALEQFQTYIIVLVFNDGTPEGWSRTRIVDCVA